MKTYAFIVAFFLCSICVLAQDITYNKTVDEIWGGRVLKRYEPTDKMTDIEADISIYIK